MARDIEEFLRMAAQRRQQQKQKQQQSRPASSETPAEKPPIRTRPAEPIVYPTPATDEEIQIIDSGTRVADIRRSSVGEHVASHIDTSSIAEHVSHLGEQVGQADDKLEYRLQQKFDHELGHLQLGGRDAQAETTAVTKRAQAKIATDLVNMLRNPTSIRQAILISEVLKRPNFD